MVVKGKKEPRVDDSDEFWLNLRKPKLRTYPYSSTGTGYFVDMKNYSSEMERSRRLAEDHNLELEVPKPILADIEKEISELDLQPLPSRRGLKPYEQDWSYHRLCDRSHLYHQLARTNKFSSRKALLDYHMDELLNIYGIYMPEFKGEQDPEIEMYLDRLRRPSCLDALAPPAVRPSELPAPALKTPKEEPAQSGPVQTIRPEYGPLDVNLYRKYSLHKTQFRRQHYSRFC